MNRFFLISVAMALSPMPVAAHAQDAAVLDAARTTVNAIFPPGTYARIMDKTFDTMVKSMMGTALDMPVKDIARMSGRGEEDIAAMNDATLKEVMAIIDPAYEERVGTATRVMMGEMAKLMTRFEPAIRDGLAEAYADRFTAVQLAELNTFFATPTGKAYAAESMAIFMDPAVVKRMQAFVPAMMQEMPGIVKKVEKATAGLPGPRKQKDLSQEDRAQLASLLGVPETEIGIAGGDGLEEVD